MLNGIKCKYVIIDFLYPQIHRLSLLKVLKYNKKLQSLFNISLNDYKTISKIIIELTISKFVFSDELFINYEQQYQPYYHAFFNKSEKEQDYAKNINLGLFDSMVHFVRSKITNKEKEIVKGYFKKKQKIKK